MVNFIIGEFQILLSGDFLVAFMQPLELVVAAPENNGGFIPESFHNLSNFPFYFL
jgi:hypothetical protein